MLKQLTSKQHLNEAYLRVYRNKGAAGVDAIQVTELKAILKVHGEHYAKQI
jgi:RNA-directed DNA polymerase